VNALRIAEATHTLYAGEGQDGVLSLEVVKMDGYIVSRWEPTPDELAELNAGGSVEVWIMGSTMPPIGLKTNPLVTDET